MSLTMFSTPVLPEWIDYNGHLSEAYYVLVFGYATDEAMAALGLGREYRESTGCSLFTVEAHVRYLREVGPDARLEVRSDVIAIAEKKLQLVHEMTVDGEPVATEELLGIHVDRGTGRASALPAATRAAAQSALAGAPAWAGRSVGV
ncbi:thioesterase family protein [Brachybacterium sp. NPDC056505]|uniref:thioesterase family protein n=1 Tax=Brachybacterium sp. NPDC056505 TaxID=3345843 RepID=UPI0036709080